MGFSLLYKVAKFGSYRDLCYQFNCTQLAVTLGESLYKTDARHPQTLLSHSTYRLLQISDNDPLSDEATINITELINGLEYFSLRIMDMGFPIRALPLINLYEWLVTDIVKDKKLSVRAKIFKVISLAHVGLIN